MKSYRVFLGGLRRVAAYALARGGPVFALDACATLLQPLTPDGADRLVGPTHHDL